MEAIQVSYLLAIGILLIGLEALTFSFILFFIGIGFVIVSIISYFYTFENGIAQIAIAFSIALILAFSLRDYLSKKISKASTKKEERTHISGIGIIEDDMIKFDGTYWKTLDDISSFKNGEQVEILDVVDNMVILKK